MSVVESAPIVAVPCGQDPMVGIQGGRRRVSRIRNVDKTESVVAGTLTTSFDLLKQLKATSFTWQATRVSP
jgi:hypothetical protein